MSLHKVCALRPILFLLLYFLSVMIIGLRELTSANEPLHMIMLYIISNMCHCKICLVFLDRSVQVVLTIITFSKLLQHYHVITAGHTAAGGTSLWHVVQDCEPR